MGRLWVQVSTPGRLRLAGNSHVTLSPSSLSCCWLMLCD